MKNLIDEGGKAGPPQHSKSRLSQIWHRRKWAEPIEAVADDLLAFSALAQDDLGLRVEYLIKKNRGRWSPLQFQSV